MCTAVTCTEQVFYCNTNTLAMVCHYSMTIALSKNIIYVQFVILFLVYLMS